MSLFRHAILAVAGILWLVSAAPAGTTPDAPAGNAESPMRLQFQLADGVRVSGRLTAWDEEGFDGSFGRRRWVDLTVADAWRLHCRVMDPRDPRHWVNLGRIMLLMDQDRRVAARRAEQAFRQAVRLDESARGLIERARAMVRRQREAAARRQAAAEAEMLRTTSPESDDWPASPWPDLTDEEQRAAVLVVQADARRVLQRAGIDLPPVETSHFILYFDMPLPEASAWGRRLERACDRLLSLLQLERPHNPFWGRAAVFAFKDRDRFRLVEADAFGQLLPGAVTAICHPMGPKVFITSYDGGDPDLLGAALVREAVHAFMHRYRTPRRLPAWANEGLADFIAAEVFDHSPVDEALRRLGLDFIRGGGDVNALLDHPYGEGFTPRDQLRNAVGRLMVELMARDRPRRFIAWIDAVKDGKDWEDALREDFRVPRASLVDTFIRYHMVND